MENVYFTDGEEISADGINLECFKANDEQGFYWCGQITISRHKINQLFDTLPEEKREIGRWGMRRKAYMKEYKSGRYNYLLLTGKLDSYLADLNEQAWELSDRLEAQMKDAEGVTEELKAENPMEWVRHCNNIRNRVDEIILNELIYV